MNVAPKGVSWGTTNTPVNERITLSKKYKTRNGKEIVGLHIKMSNSCNDEVTFPVKGSVKTKGRQPRYQIWTLDGRAGLFSESPDDLIEME